MCIIKLKNVFIAIKIIIVGYSHIIFANTQTGVLGNDAFAKDSYQVNCTSKAGVITEHIEASIADNAFASVKMYQQLLEKVA